MEHKATNAKIVADLKYNAVREYDKRGPRNDGHHVYVGYNIIIKRYIVAFQMGPDKPAAMRILGADPELDTKEKLIDFAMNLVEQIHGQLIVYDDRFAQ